MRAARACKAEPGFARAPTHYACIILVHIWTELLSPSCGQASLVDGVVTEDNDAFLFGARHVYRHLFDPNRYRFLLIERSAVAFPFVR